MYQGLRVGVVIPALNEEDSIGTVVDGLRSQRNAVGTRIVDSVVVCDNGSMDQTSARATDSGANVVFEPQKGYGRACLTAIERLRQDAPDVTIFIDGDNAFEPEAIKGFLAEISRGSDMVIGSRTKGICEKGSLSTTQIIGNRLATLLIRTFWGTSYSDLGPYRAIRSTALEQINMTDEAFGWTIEMQIKAIQHGLKITEIPVNSRNRIGESKISGTVVGVVRAGYGILSTILKLRMNQRNSNGQLNLESRSGIAE